jgi:hypothetical protein
MHRSEVHKAWAIGSLRTWIGPHKSSSVYKSNPLGRITGYLDDSRKVGVAETTVPASVEVSHNPVFRELRQRGGTVGGRITSV